MLNFNSANDFPGHIKYQIEEAENLIQANDGKKWKGLCKGSAMTEKCELWKDVRRK